MSSDDKGIDVARAATIAASEAARLGTAATIAPTAPTLGDAPTLYGASAGMGHDPTLMKVDNAGPGHDPTLMKVDTASMGHDPTLMEVVAEVAPASDARGIGDDPTLMGVAAAVTATPGARGMGDDLTLMRVDAASIGHDPALVPTSRGVGYEQTSMAGSSIFPRPQARSSSSRRMMIVAVLGAAVLVGLAAWVAKGDEESPEVPAAVIKTSPSDEIEPTTEERTPSQPRPQLDRPSATAEQGDEAAKEKGGGRRRRGRRAMRRLGLR